MYKKKSVSFIRIFCIFTDIACYAMCRRVLQVAQVRRWLKKVVEHCTKAILSRGCSESSFHTPQSAERVLHSTRNRWQS